MTIAAYLLVFGAWLCGALTVVGVAAAFILWIARLSAAIDRCEEDRRW